MVEATLRTADVEVQVVLGEGAVMPEYRTDGSAGMDVCTSADVHLEPMQRTLAPTGLRIAIPPGYEGQIRPRSGLALKHGLTMVNTPGTIDSDYRGEVGIILINLGAEAVNLKKGERIAQLVICPVARARTVEVDDLDETVRGEGGFGSTGR